jgi:hypothetical protein
MGADNMNEKGATMNTANLGQRWLAAGAPWREGMRILRRDESGWYRHGFYEAPCHVEADDHPDFDDAATRGAALAWVREAWGDPSLTLLPVDESIPLMWEWTEDGLEAPAMDARLPDGRPLYHTRWASEAEGLVAAAEARAATTGPLPRKP